MVLLKFMFTLSMSLCLQSSSYGKFHLFCCVKGNNVLLLMLEPGRNNNFFVKGERKDGIGWGRYRGGNSGYQSESLKE